MSSMPPLDTDPRRLDPAFTVALAELLSLLAKAGTPFRLVEGFRSVERQAWLYGSGRPDVLPWGRPGKWLTNADGVRQKSRHQSGHAADLYPVGKHGVYIPPATIVREGVEVLSPEWDLLANTAAAVGLVSGARWTQRDCPHVEMA